MTGLVKAIRTDVDPACIVEMVGKRRCKLQLNDAPASTVIVDFDDPRAPVAAPARRCDYLLGAEGDSSAWLVVVELKQGALDAAQVVKQLRAGASAAEKIVPRNVAARVEFRAVVASGNAPKMQRGELKKRVNRIGFYGRKVEVFWIRCGASLFGTLRR